ncbi:MAG: TetR/AcrR family transcriptional regulator [Planctomycetes bacterium]|nr:TetR/AcrR family transcriptional regulator [Planctomycetota bacterium]
MSETNVDKGRRPNVQGEQTRRTVLEVAGQVFAEKGYDGAGFRDIAARSGVGLSSIMYHFGSKQGLYLETIRHCVVDHFELDRHFEVFDALDYGDAQAVADALRTAIRSFLGACHSGPNCDTIMALYARIMVGNNLEALAMLLQCFEGVQRKLPAVARRIRPDWNDTQIAFWVQAFWAQLQYTVMGKKLVLYDMKLGTSYPESFLDRCADYLAWYAALPLGLPAPSTLQPRPS